MIPMCPADAVGCSDVATVGDSPAVMAIIIAALAVGMVVLAIVLLRRRRG